MKLVSKILTFGEGRKLREYQGVVGRINSLEPSMQALSDAELSVLTRRFKERVAAGESLDSLLPEAFAAVREASFRTLGLRHFDVQLIGGMALHEGQIAEMRTGEGKTLVAALAGYLNALGGRGVHVVTANDYLARRDAERIGRIYRFLGMTAGLVQNGMGPAERKAAYAADVTYGTASELGFDYLRDNVATSAEFRVQRGHAFAIVDEVDSILIDEARTPLIISGGTGGSAEAFRRFAAVMPGLREGLDFEIDEAKRTVAATEAGLSKIEQALGLDGIYESGDALLANHLQQALRAQFLLRRDVDYVVEGGQVGIVDEFTGRVMEGRRFSDGLHQAIEAKEGVQVREESRTLASVTLQNYFRLYGKLSGMTGTALTEEAEFRQIYGLGVVCVPPNRPVVRADEDDLVFATAEAKLSAVVEDVAERHAKGQPVLVGTASIEGSERLSALLSGRGIPHEVLNAKNHEREAAIVAQAGRKGAVTIATNMAGRGTDILLGGADASPEEREAVLALGGMRVIGTERHESRRIDNQLRGRAGRQGDPGSTRFFISLEDDLMRRFGGGKAESLKRMMAKAGEGKPVQSPAVTRAVREAQRQVEAMHFGMRKSLLEYDDVMNAQRRAVYGERQAVLDGKDLAAAVPRVIRDAAGRVVAKSCPRFGAWDEAAVEKWAADMTGRRTFKVGNVRHGGDPAKVTEALARYLQALYGNKESQLTAPVMQAVASQVMLRTLDARWMSHLRDMDALKTGIGLRAVGHRDPKLEYKEEAHKAFAALAHSIYDDYLQALLRGQLTITPRVAVMDS